MPVKHNNLQSNTKKLTILKLATINVNSIITNERRHELLKFIERNDNPHIVMLSETKLNAKHKIQFKNYNLIRTDRPKAKQGGGTAILVSREIEYEQVYSPNTLMNKTLEYTIISIKLNRTKKLFIISAYATNNNRMEFIKEFNTVFETLKLGNESNYFVLAGDLNARNQSWGDHNHNSRGVYLQRWVDDEATFYKARLYPTNEPSFIRANTYLDLCIIDNRIKILDLQNDKIKTCPYDSDHNGTKFSIEINKNHNIETTAHKPPIKLYKNTNWGKLEKCLEEIEINPIPNNTNLSNEEVDSHLKTLNEIILKAINASVPICMPNDSVMKYVNYKICKLYKIKSKLITEYNKMKRAGLSEKNTTVLEIKSTLKSIKIIIKEEFSKATTRYWANQTKAINHRKPEAFFPKINKILRNRQSIQIETLTINENDTELLDKSKINKDNLTKHNNEYVINETKDKLNLMGAYYERVNSPRPLNQGSNIEAIVNRYCDKFKEEFESQKINNTRVTDFTDKNPANVPDSQLIQNYFCSVKEVAYIIKNLPNKTSTGVDNIPSIIIKHLPMKYIRDYTILFNNLLNNRYFPKEWKTAKVLPIIKTGKCPKEMSSYRPISLNSNISKIFEAVILNSINHQCKINNAIPDNQYGFRHKLSTCHAINKFINDVNNHVKNNYLVGAALIDLEKAFDSVWIKGLIFKLIKLNFPTYLIQLIWDMITNKKFIIWNGTEMSKLTFEIKEGLQQGTVTSPVLFNIFNSSILNLFELNSGNNTYSIAFADDLILYVAGKRPIEIQDKLQNLVNNINKVYQIWNLRINPVKCESILISKTTRSFSKNMKVGKNDFRITANKPGTGELIEIPHKKIVKYLGFNIDYLLRIHQHIDIQLQKAKNAFKANSKIFYNKNLEKRAKIICYLLLIRPILTYAAPLWWNISASSMEKIRAFERKCLRACLSAYREPRYNYSKMISNEKLYRMANINRFDCHSIKLCRDYYARTKANENPEVKKLAIIDNNWMEEFKTGYIPPQAFILADKLGIIQDVENTPIIYHLRRNKAVKKLPNKYNKNEIRESVYSRTIPPKDYNDFHRLRKNYWWLAEDGIHISELRKRTKKK